MDQAPEPTFLTGEGGIRTHDAVLVLVGVAREVGWQTDWSDVGLLLGLLRTVVVSADLY